MSRTDADWVAFSRENRVAYEIAPLFETQGGERLQSGFALTFYAAVPMQKDAGQERHDAGRELREELVALADAAAPAAGRQVRVQLDPPRTAVLRPENEFKPEVALSWQLLHAGEARPTSDEDRERLAALEKRFAALGMKRGRW